MSKTIYMRSRKQNVGFTKNAESGEMQQMYVMRAVKYSTLSFDEICKNIAESLGVSIAVARASANAVVKQMRQLLLNGHSIQVGNLFYLRYGCRAAGVVDPNGKDVGCGQIVREHILVKPIGRVKKALDDINYIVTVVE